MAESCQLILHRGNHREVWIRVAETNAMLTLYIRNSLTENAVTPHMKEKISRETYKSRTSQTPWPRSLIRDTADPGVQAGYDWRHLSNAHDSSHGEA
jgi:hypothetical protein